MEHVNKFKAAIAALTGVLTALWGWMGWFVLGWVVCMAVDYLTGSLAAAKGGQLEQHPGPGGHLAQVRDDRGGAGSGGGGPAA